MKALIQKVKQAKVWVENKVIGQIDQGLLIFLGVEKNDTEKDSDYLAEKIVNLRLFSGTDKPFHFSLLDVQGQILVISQFTLCADCRQGRRPDFIGAERPELAEYLYENFVTKLKSKGLIVETGEFGAYMLVTLENDGPVTLMIESKY